MLLLGLLLVGATAAFTGLLVADNNSGSPDYSVVVLGHHIATMNTLSAFLAGAALALVCCLGLAMMSAGGRRVARRRADLRSARRDARDAAAERDQLAARVADDPEPEPDPVARESAEPVSGARHRQGRQLFGH